MKPAIDRIVFATDRPLLVVGFREVLRRAGLEAEPWVLEPAFLVDSLPPRESWLVMLDGESLLPWEALDEARRRSPKSRFVICCGVIAPELLLAAMEHEVDGIVSTRIPVPEATEALARICNGERQYRFQDRLESRPPCAPSLSPRERVVLAMVADGLRNRQIAASLGTSENSVKVHIHRLLRKTGTKRRQELALLAAPILARANAEPELSAFDDKWMFGGNPA
jgi:two-component system nitrate/nitrite response regulator NarP